MPSLRNWLATLSGHSMGRRFAILILIFSSVVTLFSTALQLGLDYRHDVEDIDTQLAQIYKPQGWSNPAKPLAPRWSRAPPCTPPCPTCRGKALARLICAASARWLFTR